jgi:putative ABC transport system permease protein
MIRVISGIGAGIVAAVALDRLLQSVLFGVETTDPRTIAIVAMVMLIAGVAATSLPIRRAIRVDPITALRSE